MDSPNILLIVGTHRPGSRTQQVADLYAQLLAERGLASNQLSLAELPHEFLFSDLYGQRSDAFRAIEQRVYQADVLVLIAPEYNGSYPGELKLFLDALNRKHIAGKQAAMIGLGAGKFGNLRGLDHLAGVLSYMQIETMPFRAHLMHIDQRLDSATGQLTHEASAQELAMHASKLAQLVRQLAPQAA